MTNTPLRIIITGATGMVGEGVLHTCLEDSRVEAVCLLSRKTLGLSHPKLKEVLHPDFYNISAVENELQGYNACFFCLGVSSVGMKEADYFKATYTLTMHVAETLARLNPDMIFCYISGQGTDSTEKGRSMWARVKGKTENDLMKLPFRRVYAYRPGFIKPIPGLSKTLSFYRYVNWLYPIGRALYPNGFNTLREIGRSMIQVALEPYPKTILNGKEITDSQRKAE